MAISPNLQTVIEQIKIECERLTMENVEVYDVKGYSPLTDVVVVATATHILQLEAARRSLAQITKTAGFPVQNPTEDYSEGWLAMDCVDLVIHILVEEKRAFYDLDSLMDSITRSTLPTMEDLEDSDGEIDEATLEEILDQLTDEELDDFLGDLEENSDHDENESK